MRLARVSGLRSSECEQLVHVFLICRCTRIHTLLHARTHVHTFVSSSPLFAQAGFWHARARYLILGIVHPEPGFASSMVESSETTPNEATSVPFPDLRPPTLNEVMASARARANVPIHWVWNEPAQDGEVMTIGRYAGNTFLEIEEADT